MQMAVMSRNNTNLSHGSATWSPLSYSFASRQRSRDRGRISPCGSLDRSVYKDVEHGGPSNMEIKQFVTSLFWPVTTEVGDAQLGAEREDGSLGTGWPQVRVQDR